MLTTSPSRGKKQVPEWFKDRISTHTAAGLLSTFSCFYSFSSCSKRRTFVCMCVCVCVSFQIHTQNQRLKLLRKTLLEIFRSLWSIISLLTSPIKKVALRRENLLVSLDFLCHFSFYHLHSSQIQKGEDNLEYEANFFRIGRPSFSLLLCYKCLVCCWENHFVCPISQFPNCNVGITLHVVLKVVGR